METTKTESVVRLLRDLADALEAGRVIRWGVEIENELADISSGGRTHAVETGRREITFRCEVGL